MYPLLDIQKKVLPDLLAIMQKRYDILRYIKFMQPVGRRSLANSLDLTERTLRSEVDFLKDQNLIEVFSSGMRLSTEGVEILEQLEGVMREISGLDKMEQKLKQLLNVNEVIIVAGNSDQSSWVKSELGKAGAARMKKEWKAKNIIAVTGGSTMAEVAKMLTPDSNGKDILFVPARGGLGEEIQNQANVIVAKMAEKTNAAYKVLYLLDQVSDEAYQSFMKEPMIKDVISLIKSATIVLHGIGDAMVMSERRKTPSEIIKTLEQKEAVGEAFGYYFDEDGEVVHKVQTIGIQLEDLDQAKRVIAVAGGESKAKAIRAYMKRAPQTTVLITDEAAAQQLIKG
ncbi:sugar-binding transcriptional regulator [Peribacillus huizhouensis]|uniref:Central glycolytic genes regulator n=1 Tax=Peribacillus huizhouensis TaxID=1501239 RepID=A0ABR6CP82_9BACI|nr:sugar-binding domain-containing protein [Peribacillus huizhouensis]MBA9026809.1 central glycolytic genes regulator [Peribacillus huizhouensis]